MDYSKLRDLLVAGDWQEADEETARIMQRVAGREKGFIKKDKDLLM